MSLRAPLFDLLDDAERVLIAGAGGGFDIYCGLPLYFALESQGKEVHLANLSFSNLGAADGLRRTPHVLDVTAQSGGNDDYFPERHLCEWFRAELDRDVVVHAFDKTGVVPLKAAYDRLVSDLAVDAIVLVDGGTDSLMRGDEAGLGTPVEDMASIAAVHALHVPRKALVCLGFGIDAFHGVCHAHFLEAAADLTRSGASLGTVGLVPSMPEVQLYLDAVAYVERVAPMRPSIVNTSIASAIEGRFGDHHRTTRTQGSELFINPLMTLYLAYQLDAVAERVLYLKHLQHTQTMFEIAAIIEAFRREVSVRPRRAIPV